MASNHKWLNTSPDAPPVDVPKRITVIGAGHVGVPHAAVIAKKCPDVTVTVVDEDPRKIAGWNSSLLPFYEPGLQETIEEVRGTNLFFTTDIESAIVRCVFCLPTRPLWRGLIACHLGHLHSSRAHLIRRLLPRSARR